MIRFCSLLLVLAAALFAEPVDWIWSARYVIIMDPQRRVIDHGAVAMRGDRIVAAGTKAEIDRDYQPRERLERPDALIAPGLINTHGHAPMVLLRGIADDLRLQEWLERYIFPAEARNVTPDFVRWGTRLACLEMLLGGTTTFADMYYFEDTIAATAKEAGMRGVLGETIIGFPSPDAKTPADALRFTERFLARYRGDPLITAAVAPHAIFTNSDETLREARALANRYSAPLLIHLSETKRENDDIVAKRGRSPAQALDALGVFNGRTLAAHAVWVDDADLKILRDRHVGIAHCPSSNMKLASGVAPVMKMLALDLAVGLGTDGPAGSNNDLNMFEEMDLAAKLQKVTTGDPEALTARQAIEMATIRGARGLGVEKEIGSLEPGKRADLIVVRLDRPNAVPLYDVYSQMVFALKASDVQDVMVNGRFVVRNGQPLTIDAKQVLAKAEEYGGKVKASLKK
ncbi:MAG TPA: amidohydrolase [Bryobacteraceae bacterium]|nr:amidohydrolase [Bryobacteraceae bacterium]